MKHLWMVVALFITVGASAQTPKPKSESKSGAKLEAQATIASAQVPGRKELLRNKRVTVATVELPAGQSTPMHRHERDALSIVLTDGQLRETLGDASGATKKIGRGFSRLGGAMRVSSGDRVAAGDVRYHEAGYTHSEENRSKDTMRAVVIEFADKAGKQQDPQRRSNRYCNEKPSVVSSQPSEKTKARACVEEKYLFCTDCFCAEEVTMDPGAVTSRHSHATDHMLVAVTHYQLTDVASPEIRGKQSKKIRTKKAGEVEYIASGIAHQLTNTGGEKARFVVVTFR